MLTHFNAFIVEFTRETSYIRSATIHT